MRKTKQYLYYIHYNDWDTIKHNQPIIKIRIR